MSGFYQIEQNLPTFRVTSPLFTLQGDVRELRLETQYNGGIFSLEPTKDIIMYNAAYRGSTAFATMSGFNTGSISQLNEGFQSLNANVATNITSYGAVSTLNGLRDVFITAYTNNAAFAIYSAYLTGKLTDIFATARVVNGIRQTLGAPTPISPAFKELLLSINAIFDAVELRDYAAATAARTAYFVKQDAIFPTVIAQLSTAYGGSGFNLQTQAYLGALLTAFNETPPTNDGDTQAIVDLAKQKL